MQWAMTLIVQDMFRFTESYFDTGKADIKPESDAAIAQISILLKNNESLKLVCCRAY